MTNKTGEMTLGRPGGTARRRCACCLPAAAAAAPSPTYAALRPTVSIAGKSPFVLTLCKITTAHFCGVCKKERRRAQISQKSACSGNPLCGNTLHHIYRKCATGTASQTAKDALWDAKRGTLECKKMPFRT